MLLVVIPHYGPNALLEHCRKAVRSVVTLKSTVIKEINANHPRKLFTAAVNEGLKLASNFTHVWLLNNDARPLPGAVRSAMKCFEQEERCGLVGSQCRHADRPNEVVWGGSLQMYPKGRHKAGYADKGEFQTRTEEEWISFASVFIKSEVVRDIGLLDANMRHICSDADYCLRARAAGWKCFHEPKSKVLHACGTSHKGGDPLVNEAMTKDSRYFERKWLSADIFPHLTRYAGKEYIGEKTRWKRPPPPGGR
jgi:GT2 family glycosyltransferase